MNTPLATRPTEAPAMAIVRWIRLHDLAKVSSASRPGVEHTVNLRVRSCTCEAMQFNVVRNPDYICRHIPFVESAAATIAAQAARRAARPICPVCKVNYLGGMTTCSAECAAVAAAQVIVEQAPAVVESALCAGYLHLHAAAPGSNVQCYWCAACTPAADRYESGIYPVALAS